MAAIDFPAAPAVNQIFVAPNGVTYQWNGTLWLAIGATQALFVGDNPPPSPGPNQLWWNSASGQMYLWYNDGSSTQWVPTTPTLPVGVPAPVGFRQIASIAVANQPSVSVPNIPADINHLQVRYDLVPATNNVDLFMQFYDGAGVLDAAANYRYANTINYSSGGASGTPQMVTSTWTGITTGILLSYGVTGGSVGNAATVPANSIRGGFEINNIRDATKAKGADGRANYVNSANTYLVGVSSHGYRYPAGAITGFLLYFSGGSAIAGPGNVTVWGSP